MRETRFFVEGKHALGASISLAPGDARKLISVLRAKTGDVVEIIDSTAQRFFATLAIDGLHVVATLDSPLTRASTELSRHVDLAQALPKGQKMDDIVEKATELGVTAIRPFVSERCIVRDASPARIERWNRIARSAAEQSGRERCPEVLDVLSYGQMLAVFKTYDLVLFAWEMAPSNLHASLIANQAGNVLVVIGPEGGFSHTEADEALSAGARIVGLGPRIFRTETAALVVLSIVGYEIG